MMTATVTIELVQQTCRRCQGVYAMDSRWMCEARRAGASMEWHCPYCHATWRYTESEADRLKASLKRESDAMAATRARLDQAERAKADAQLARAAAEATLAKAQKTATNAKRRALAGVCPCCKHTVRNMVRHIRDKHPEHAIAVPFGDEPPRKAK